MKKIILFLTIFSFTFGSCNFLDLVPENDIESVESIFEKRDQTLRWLESCYSYIPGALSSMRRNPAVTGADEFTALEYARGENFIGFKIADGLQMSQSPHGDVWKGNSFFAALRYCNIFLENIHRVHMMPDSEKMEWEASAKALKAYYYFEMVRRYGPIILVPENQATSDPIEDMQKPRVHVDTCFKRIVQLLDEAIVYLPPKDLMPRSFHGFFNLEAAYALKAKVLVFAASPMFNGNEFYKDFVNKNGEKMFSDTYDPERWKVAAEAVQAALNICDEYNRVMYDFEENKGSELLNTMSNLENSAVSLLMNNREFLWYAKDGGSVQGDPYFYYTLPRFRSVDEQGNTDPHFSMFLTGTVSPSMKMVEMYYTANGLPINYDKEWDYEGRYTMGKESDAKYKNVVKLNSSVLKLHLRREPRFYASIAADRTYWQRGPGANNLLLVEPYRGEYFGSQFPIISSSHMQNPNGYWLKKMTTSNVVTNEYKIEVESYNANPNPIIRVSELYLMLAECWNEYEGPTKRVIDAINAVRDRAGIPDVESAWRNFSTQPTKYTTKEGMREIIHHETNVELAFEGQRFWNLRRWKTAHLELNDVYKGWNILGTSPKTFYNDYKGPVVVWDKVGFVSPRDYLFPINSEEIVISGCVQNPGW